MKNDNRNRDLWLGLLFDGIGMTSYAVPMLGEFSDVVWAPVAGILMAYLYKGKTGKAAGLFAFLEEIVPFSDFIPSFTLMWWYTYELKKGNPKEDVLQ